MMILSVLLILAGYFGLRIGGPIWPAATVSAVLLLLYLLHDLGILSYGNHRLPALAPLSARRIR